MIRIVEIPISAKAQKGLAKYQAQINSQPTHAEKIALAQSLWPQKNKVGAILEARSILGKMCSGLDRCWYCESSEGTDIEHFKPKSLYPECTFVWDNFLYACTTCNNPRHKGTKFAVFSLQTGEFIEIVSGLLPPEGMDVLINPRKENPMDFLRLDLADTFLYQPIAKKETSEYQRADYTVKTLGLNSRDLLKRHRRNAFESCHSNLAQYIQLTKQNRFHEAQAKKQAICETGHVTVWHEMKRCCEGIPKLKKLFSKAPEALDW